MDSAIFFLLFSDTGGPAESMLYATTERVLASVLVKSSPITSGALFDTCIVTQVCTWHITQSTIARRSEE